MWAVFGLLYALCMVAFPNLNAAEQSMDLAVSSKPSKARVKTKKVRHSQNTRRKHPPPSEDESDEEDDYDDAPSRSDSRRRRTRHDDDHNERQGRTRFNQDEGYRPGQHESTPHQTMHQSPQHQKPADDSVVVVRAGSEEKKGNDFTKIIQGLIAIEALKSIMTGNGDSSDVANVADAAEGG